MEDNEKIIKKSVQVPSDGYIDVFYNREIWSEIAKELHGEFKIHLTASNILEYHVLTIPYDKWEIVLTISDTRPLKASIKMVSVFEFEMFISWEDIIDKILKRFGMTEITLGWDSFDNKYLIISNKPDLVKAIITREIQVQLLKLNVCSFSLQSNTKDQTTELITVIQRNIGGKKMILEIIDLLKTIIDKLKHNKIIK